MLYPPVDSGRGTKIGLRLVISRPGQLLVRAFSEPEVHGSAVDLRLSLLTHTSKIVRLQWNLMKLGKIVQRFGARFWGSRGHPRPAEAIPGRNGDVFDIAARVGPMCML